MGTESAFGAVFAIMWLGEYLSLVQVLGGGLMVVCAIYSSVGKVEEPA